MTNDLYARLDAFIRAASAEYTKPGDLIVAYPNVPMVYMLASRRPAIKSNWIGFDEPPSAIAIQVSRMLAAGRKPKLIFRFRSYPVLRRVGLEPTEMSLPDIRELAPGFQFDGYTLKNATLVRSFSAAPISPKPLLDVYLTD